MTVFAPHHFMILPTMACQASCRYCFAQKTGEVMSRATAVSAVDFIERIANPRKEIHITFHGGEPLLAGEDFYAWILPLLASRFGRRLRLAVQSNLWAVTDGLADLFRRYRVSVGTSVDGDEAMCDAQRGQGYYARTKAGEALLARHGITVGEICTFAAENTGRAAEVFQQSSVPYAIHGAVPVIGRPAGDGSVSPAGMKQILLDSYEAYRADPAHSRITTIDAAARGCLNDQGDLCTFFDCLGSFAAIAPDGGVYSCQRFCGMDKYCLGNVLDGLTEEDIGNSAAFRLLRAAEEGKRAVCDGCEHWNRCSGGCLYSTLAAGTGKDPYCEAYRALFDHLQIDMAVEMGESLLKRETVSPVLAMAGERPHPWDEAQNRIRLAEAVRRGRSPDPWSDTLRFPWPEENLNKLYLHVTFDCPLRCPHCYAEGGERRADSLPPERFAEIVRRAVSRRFRAVVITGGEPMAWPGFDEMCRELASADRKGTRLILRSSFGFEIPDNRIGTAATLFDEIVVSVDGDRAAHDLRRGAGRYDKAVDNLKKAKEKGAKLSLAAALDFARRDNAQAESVYRLAEELGIENVKLRPVLPLGRAKETAQPSWRLCGEEDLSGLPFHPRFSCGLGQNLYVEPDGTAYPCYAWCAPEAKLGDLGREGLDDLLERGELYAYCRCDVDSNAKCRRCEVRYLCGGICKAWVRDRQDPDSGDFDCTERKEFYLRLADSVSRAQNGTDC